MNIEILCVGKIKEPFLKDAIAEYKKRLSKYCRLKIVETADEKAAENLSAAECEIVKAKEGERLRRGERISFRYPEGRSVSMPSVFG